MDTVRKPEYRMRFFENAFLKHKWKQFREFFADVMERAHPKDFVRMKEAGPKGDRGCDGYLRSTKTIFQVYAPNAIRGLAELHRKIEEDFEKARNAGLELKRWIFVHNCRQGLHAESLASEGLSQKDGDAITGAFVEHQFGCFPIEAALPESAVWAFDAPLAPAFNESSEAMQALFEGIIEVSRRVDDERVLELAHIFAEQHENCERDQESRSWFFAMTVLAATAVGRVSAVRRIVSRPSRDRDQSAVCYS